MLLDNRLIQAVFSVLIDACVLVRWSLVGLQNLQAAQASNYNRLSPVIM